MKTTLLTLLLCLCLKLSAQTDTTAYILLVSDTSSLYSNHEFKQNTGFVYWMRGYEVTKQGQKYYTNPLVVNRIEIMASYVLDVVHVAWLDFEKKPMTHIVWDKRKIK